MSKDKFPGNPDDFSQLFNDLGQNHDRKFLPLANDFSQHEYMAPHVYEHAGMSRVPYADPLLRGPLDFSRVNLEALYKLGDVVLEPVPESKRVNYRYWRGAHLGKIAMTFARGQHHLNAGPELIAHFSDQDYSYARHTAADRGRVTQFGPEDAAELSAATGGDPRTPLPSIVFALDSRFNDAYMPPSSYGAQQGVVFEGTLQLQHIDHYSRSVIEELMKPSE